MLKLMKPATVSMDSMDDDNHDDNFSQSSHSGDEDEDTYSSNSSYTGGSGTFDEDDDDDDDDGTCSTSGFPEALPKVVSFEKENARLPSAETESTMSGSSSSSSDDDDHDDDDDGDDDTASLVDHNHKAVNPTAAAATAANFVATETTSEAIEATSNFQDNPTENRLMFMLDEVHELARMGRNATLRTENVIPHDTSKSDIYVHVDIDERVRAHNNPKQKAMEDATVAAIRDDLRTVYSSPSPDDAELVLCIVVVVLTDGSMTRSYWYDSKYGIAGLAEIGLVWQLFEADTLKVFGGGVITQREDWKFGVLDFFQHRGKACLSERLAPKVASMVMSKIGAGVHEELLVEI